MFDAGLHVGKQAVIADVSDLVDRVRRDGLVWMCFGIGAEFVLDLFEPLIEHLLRSCIECGERTDNAGLALSNDQLRAGDDKHWRPDHGDSQISFKTGWQWHQGLRTSAKNAGMLTRT